MFRIYEPNFEAALLLVKHLDNDHLKDLVNNDDAVAKLVKTVEQCKELEHEKDIIMTQNKSLAEYNLSLGPKLDNGKSKLSEIFESVQSVWDSIQEKQSQLKKDTGYLNGETALALLQTAAVESEEESEKIADKFYQKEIEIEGFLEQFQSVRRQMHLRRVKADKMKDLLLKKPTNSTYNAPYPKLPSAVPYPVSSVGMPYFPTFEFS